MNGYSAAQEISPFFCRNRKFITTFETHVTGPYSEPEESIPHYHNLFL
jgi:hypothetical protein